MQTLYNNLEIKVPIWCVSHAGHYDIPGVQPLKGKSMDWNAAPCRHLLWNDMTWYLFLGYLIIGNESLYGLDGQVHHKLAFLNATLTKDCKITFIGHSIGCQIIMELMKELSYEDVFCDKTKPISQTLSALTINKAYFLFPTIERMRQTPAGRVTWIQVTQ